MVLLPGVVVAQTHRGVARGVVGEYWVGSAAGGGAG